MDTRAKQFARVAAIARSIKEQRAEQEQPTTISDAVTIAAAYLLAMDRTGLHHHPEDRPSSVAWAEHIAPDDATLMAMTSAHAAVWGIIDRHNSRERYEAAWYVWGVVLPPSDDTEGMEQQ